MIAPALVALVVAQAPEAAVWTLELGGVPAAVVRARREEGAFTWSVERLFRRADARSVKIAVDARGRDEKGRVPEGLWFWKRPAAGCVKGVDEVSGREGELCLEAGDGGVGRGTALGAPFAAAWSSDGALARLEISGAVYTPGAAWTGQDPWAAGLAIEGKKGKLSLSPPLAGAALVDPPPRATGAAPVTEDCLALAGAEVALAAGKKEVVLGLVVEGDRAWPHAWVRALGSGAHEDPSVPAGERPARAYLALPAGSAGRVYLDLLNGRAKLARR